MVTATEQLLGRVPATSPTRAANLLKNPLSAVLGRDTELNARRKKQKKLEQTLDQQPGISSAASTLGLL